MRRTFPIGCLTLLLTLTAPTSPAADAPKPTPTHWDWCGWGGGGYMWAAAYHPTKPGVLYMGGDCAGVYKSADDARHWRMINDGLIDYAVYSLAVSPAAPDTVYALTDGGLCKSIDAGEHWTFLPESAKSKLGIVSERHVSVRAIAIDPTNADIVYAGTPTGRLYKSTDGGKSWAQSFAIPAAEGATPDALRTEYGQPFGGFFMPIKGADNSKSVRGLGLAIKANGVSPRVAFVTVQRADGAIWRSRNLSEDLAKTDWQDVVLSADDFAIDPDHAKQKKDKAATWPAKPEWAAINRMDVTCAGIAKAPVILIRSVYYATIDNNKQLLRDFGVDKKVLTYGNLHTAGPKAPAVAGVAVSPKDPRLVMLASPKAGVFVSRDAGATWEPAPSAGKNGQSVTPDPKDASTWYAAAGTDGFFKSTDAGRTWTAISQGVKKNEKMIEIAVSPASSSDLVAIGTADWNGTAYWSDDAGQTWHGTAKLAKDLAANPTFGMDNLSAPTNITICPTDPKKVFISSNWRPVFSEDGGRTWAERDRGADISCVYDVRFSGTRAYAACMDEGVLYTDDNGAAWHQAWPTGGPLATKLTGHYWRLAITAGPAGADRIVSTCSPWDATQPNRVVLSEDGAKTFKLITGKESGLLPYKPVANTMWGQSYPRALAVDPKDAKTMYMGMDGDPEGDTKPGGGIFKSTDGGYTWTQLPHQPGSRRMFFGLAVDPTDSKRLYWGACGTGGGLWRSDDGGDSWRHVFKNETWIFNIHVTADGTVYAPGKDLWRSTDHGATWRKLTNLAEGQIMGLEVHPRDPKTIWFSTVKHGGAVWGSIMKSTDAGATWHDITGDIGYRKPTVLRFNPETNELWAGGVGLFKTKQ